MKYQQAHTTPSRRPTAIHAPPDKNYLARKDNTPFFWLADTWWFGTTKRMTGHMLDILLADRTKKGFTVILIVIGVPPEVDPFSSEAQNEGGSAFLQNGELNAKYFDHADIVIQKILDAGLIPCIVGSWGNHIDRFGVEAMKKLWKEIISRWGNLPVAYCLTGEVDLAISGDPTSNFYKLCINVSKKLQLFKIKPIRKLGTVCISLINFFGAKKNKTLLENRLSQWAEVAKYIRSIDTNNHVLLVHPHRKYRASVLFHEPDWLDVDSIQSGHTLENSGFLVQSALAATTKNKPFINLEPWYEGIFGNFGPEYQRYAFWMSVLAGATGHTYGAHGIWQMANGDNFMGHWGNSDWKTAMSYAGSKQLGKAKQFLEKYPWWTFTAYLQAVTPSWNEAIPFRPMAAMDADGRLWIYKPIIGKSDKSSYTIQLHDTHKYWQATWIDPSSMQIIQKQEVASSFSLNWHMNKDLLILVEPIL